MIFGVVSSSVFAIISFHLLVCWWFKRWFNSILRVRSCRVSSLLMPFIKMVPNALGRLRVRGKLWCYHCVSGLHEALLAPVLLCGRDNDMEDEGEV